MKKIVCTFILTALCAVSSFAGSGVTNGVVTKEEASNGSFTEIIYDNDLDCCLIRTCWLEGKVKKCTEWQEVPCTLTGGMEMIKVEEKATNTLSQP